VSHITLAQTASGYYWAENDPLIAETDNFPSIYMPWRQWVCYWNQKVIDIGGGAARMVSGTPPAAIS
jgi:hypothetical protein